MMFARLNPDTGIPESRDFAEAPGRKGWVPLVIDVQPAPSATQIVVNAGIVVGPLEAHQTWSLRAKTALELEFDSLRDEHALLVAIVADLQAQRAVDRATWDGYTAAQLRAEQWRDRQVLLRFAHFAARRIKAGL